MIASRSPASVRYIQNIRAAGLTIYDPIAIGDLALWIPTPDLERLLDAGCAGFRLLACLCARVQRFLNP